MTTKTAPIYQNYLRGTAMTIKKAIFIFVYLLTSITLIANNTLLYSKIIDKIIIEGPQSQPVLSAINAIPLSTTPESVLDPTLIQDDLKTLYATGYFSSINAQSTQEKDQHILHIICIENPNIQTLAIQTQSSFIQNKLQKSFKKFLNTPLNTPQLNDTKQTLITWFKKQGYSFFDIITMSFHKQSQTLHISATDGIIESISFKGLKNVNKTILLREMSQKKGHVFNEKTIRKDREKLLRLGYFSAISAPQFKKGSLPNKLQLSFTVTEKKVNSISLGVEQDQTQFLGFISSIRNHNVITSDITSIKTQFELLDSNLSLSSYTIIYSQPWLLNKFRTAATLSYYNKEIPEVLNNNSTTSKRNGFNTALTFPLSHYLSLKTSLKKEQVSNVNSSDNIPTYHLNSLTFKLNYNSTQTTANPKKGHIANLVYEKGNDLGPITLGGLSFSRISSSLSKYLKLSTKGILAFRTQAGIYFPNKANSQTYENEYFIVGGSSTIRGYNELRTPFTGTRKVLINTEYRHNFSKTIQAILFYDRGNAFDGSFDINNTHSSTGIGFRYITPIGPIRLDLAKGDSDLFLHFGLGQLF